LVLGSPFGEEERGKAASCFNFRGPPCPSIETRACCCCRWWLVSTTDLHRIPRTSPLLLSIHRFRRAAAAVFFARQRRAVILLSLSTSCGANLMLRESDGASIDLGASNTIQRGGGLTLIWHAPHAFRPPQDEGSSSSSSSSSRRATDVLDRA
jgi:hypothetical protein